MEIRVPIIDGHAWVVRDDGTIVDPWTKWFDAVCNIKHCKKERRYLPAPPLIQEIILKMYRDPIEEAGFDMMELSSKAATERVFDMCIFNAAREVYTNGGTLVVGSMGFVMDDAEGTIWWEYGGPGYRVHQFIKNRIGCTIKIGE